MPDDSPVRHNYVEDGVYAPNNAIYELRPFPAASEAGDARTSATSGIQKRVNMVEKGPDRIGALNRY